MRRLVLIAAVTSIVLAKPSPESYKETEDFQYSRSSSDDGSKSGYYGAQRGNMGGNYERAHNMDNLAQHQMSGLVRQVDGELGDGAKTRTGSVYSAANSRGIYGSGSYDLRNLEGRNFAEGESLGDSQSQWSRSSQNSRYGSHSYSGMDNSAGISSSHSQNSRYSGYRTTGHTDQRQIDNLQAADTSQDLGRYENSNQAGYNTNYQSQFGSHSRSEYDQSSSNHQSANGYDANSRSHYVTTPVRVVLRPGGRVAIPITAPTYSVSQNILPEDINSDAEVFTQQAGSAPTNKVKHYEASYSYRKQWEKHHTLPGDSSVVISTESPFPKNTELYEDAQLLQSSKDQFQNANLQTVHSGDTNSDHRANTKSTASSRSRYQEGYNSQQSQSGLDSEHRQADYHSQQTHSGIHSQHSQSGSRSHQLDYNQLQRHTGQNSQQSSGAFHANEYGSNSQISGLSADLTNTAGDVNSKPKSYQSSYSYHKSWERKGDPYLIKPVEGTYNGQASEKLMAASANRAAYSSSQHGSGSRQTHHSYSADCDDASHIRVARSYNTNQELEQNQNPWEDLGQQTQNQFGNLEDLGQQTQNQFGNLEDLGQQTQNQFGNLEDLGQQTQNQYGNLEDLGQQTQNQWDNLQQIGQETQNQWDNLQQVGQETQNQWDNLQQVGQQTQNQWDNLQQMGQETQNKWDNLEDLGQHAHRDLEQHQNENTEDFNHQHQNESVLTNFEQQTNNQNENLGASSLQSQKEDILTNFEQQTSNQNEKLDVFNQQNNKEDILTNFEQHGNNQNDNLDDLSQHSQNQDMFTNSEQFHSQNKHHVSYPHSQYEGPLPNFEPQTNNKNDNFPNSNNWFKTQETESQSNVDKNFDSYDFMKPITSWPNNSDKKIQQHEEDFNTEHSKHNLFPEPSSNTEYNNFWSQSKEQDFSWNMNNNQNNFNTQFGNPQSSISTSDMKNPLQSLWEKIDNIAGEFTATDDNMDKKELFSHDYHSQNENVHQMQNNYNWTNNPVNPNVDLVNTNTNMEPKDHGSGHNLFDDESDQHVTTTVSLTFLSNNSATQVNNTNKSTNTLNQHSFVENQNINSKDEGRGDIGPEESPLEIMSVDKPYNTSQNIGTLSHKKETRKEDNAIVQPSSTQNKDENTDSKILEGNLYQQESTSQILQNELLTTKESRETTTVPALHNSTTVKSNMNIYEQSANLPDILNLNNNSIPNLQNQIFYQQTVNENIPKDVQQHNLEQYEDFGQLQSSLFPIDNLQQDNQQNIEQQFEDFQQNYHQDFEQHVQSFQPLFKDVQNEEREENENQHNNKDNLDSSSNYDNKMQSSAVSRNTNENIQKPIEQHLQANRKIEGLTSQTQVQSPVDTSTESPGFWKSVGNKFTSAKNKVISWFSGS